MIDPRQLVVLDEAGANLAMGRSHAWVIDVNYFCRSHCLV
jgi:hypothetical protein